MTIEEIYKLAVKMGVEADPRDKDAIQKILDKTKKEYEKLDKEEKQEFDTEKLNNPFGDTRILTGDLKKNIRTVMSGIDIEPAGILLADRLNEKGENIDLIISHHPEGVALANLALVMGVQADLSHKFGVPINVAEGLMAKRIAEVARGINPINHNEAVDMAKILGLAFMCTHTIADNLAYKFIQDKMDKDKPETVDDVIKIIKGIPEYKEALKINAGPMIFAGSGDRRAGKVAALGFTGGTSGPKEIYERLSNAGVGTVIAMHIKEDERTEAEKYNINIVIAGHIASDSLGMNIFLDKLEEKGIKIIPMGGFIRISRNKNK